MNGIIIWTRWHHARNVAIAGVLEDFQNGDLLQLWNYASGCDGIL